MYQRSVAPRPDDRRWRRAAEYSDAHRGFALLVIQDGEIVYEAYRSGFSAGQAHQIASGTKSFWGPLATIATNARLLSLDERVAETVREWRIDPRKSRVTIRQLLNMTSGLAPGSRELNDPGTTDAYKAALDLPMLDEPGAVYRYGPGHLMVFGALLRRKLGRDPLAYLDEVILTPIGVSYQGWRKDRAGNSFLPNGAVLTARDWARYGEVIRRRGLHESRQVIPPEGVKACLRGSEANRAYGLTFWLNKPIRTDSPTIDFSRAFATLDLHQSSGLLYGYGPDDLIQASGSGNQRLIICPSRGLVAARFGERDAGWNDAAFLGRLLDDA